MFSFVVLHVQCKLCLCDKYSCLLKRSTGWEIFVYFAIWLLFFHRADLAVLVIFVQFHTSVVNNGLCAARVYCRQIACFLCVSLSQRIRLFLIQIHQNAEAKTEISPPSSDRALYSDKARSFNQSQRAFYRNFIISWDYWLVIQNVIAMVRKVIEYWEHGRCSQKTDWWWKTVIQMIKSIKWVIQNDDRYGSDYHLAIKKDKLYHKKSDW